MAVCNVLRIHSEADCFLALAAASIAFRSSGVTRIRKNSTFALPLGGGGRGKRCRNHRENFRDVFAFFFTSRKACMKKMANGSMRVCGLCAGRGLRQDWGAHFRKLRGRADGKCNQSGASVAGQFVFRPRESSLARPASGPCSQCPVIRHLRESIRCKHR
jgi:hypothetical protein